jgi:hypothetical protein
MLLSQIPAVLDVGFADALKYKTVRIFDSLVTDLDELTYRTTEQWYSSTMVFGSTTFGVPQIDAVICYILPPKLQGFAFSTSGIEQEQEQGLELFPSAGAYLMLDRRVLGGYLGIKERQHS